jgi:hypothetical protein
MNIQKLMKQMQKAQLAQAEMQEKLESSQITASAGGGMVNVTVNGAGQVMSLKLDKAVVDPNDTEALEDLILVAIQDAQRKANELQQTEMNKLMGGLNIPGMR